MRPHILNNLAIGLSQRYEHDDQLEDLSMALRVYREAPSYTLDELLGRLTTLAKLRSRLWSTPLKARGDHTWLLRERWLHDRPRSVAGLLNLPGGDCRAPRLLGSDTVLCLLKKAVWGSGSSGPKRGAKPFSLLNTPPLSRLSSILTRVGVPPQLAVLPAPRAG